MPNTNSDQPSPNIPNPDPKDLQVHPPVPRPFMAGISTLSESAQADFVAAGHPGATLVASQLPLPQQAFTLYCQGLRSDTIAAQLGVPARTIRRWLQRISAQLAATTREQLRAELLRAIETQRAVLAAAWSAYERENRLEDAILAGHYDRLRRRAYHPSTANVDADSPSPRRERGSGGEETLLEEYDRPFRLNSGARYLAVIVTAQREIARLQGLGDLALDQPDNFHITITRRPDGPENFPPEERAIHFPHLYRLPNEHSQQDDHADDQADDQADETSQDKADLQ
jgi:hypothetical protein